MTRSSTAHSTPGREEGTSATTPPFCGGAAHTAATGKSAARHRDGCSPAATAASPSHSRQLPEQDTAKTAHRSPLGHHELPALLVSARRQRSGTGRPEPLLEHAAHHTGGSKVRLVRRSFVSSARRCSRKGGARSPTASVPAHPSRETYVNFPAHHCVDLSVVQLPARSATA